MTSDGTLTHSSSVGSAEIVQIVQDVFQTMLGMDVEPSEQEWLASERRVTSVVRLAGDWTGAALIECSLDQAFIFTSRLMPVPQPDTFTGEVRDALGELSNMVGGNLKSLLPHGVTLAMPVVTEGHSHAVSVCGGNLVTRQAFDSSVGVFWVTVVETVLLIDD